jgi:hypothetical protein
MNMWLLFVSMQMCDPAAHTYDHEMDDTDAEMLVAIYAVDIWSRSFSQVPRRTLVETGIQWVERTLENSNDCFDMFLSHPALTDKVRCISYMRQEDNIYNNRVHRDKCHKTSEYLLHSGRLITK